MSFLVTAALAIAVLVLGPLAAHLLRRGPARQRPFPAARLLDVTVAASPQKSRLQDRLLLLVRGLLIVGLALLGATPLMRCSRLSLARHSGASVAFAIVLDDSLSMRAVTDNRETRWQRAQNAARQLLDDAREGDAVSLVLAGEPARLKLTATTDLESARQILDDFSPSDRSTDLVAAVQLARGALKSLPHSDKRVILLSDLAGEEVPDGKPSVWMPLKALHEPMDDCAIVEAERHGKTVTVTLACTSEAASQDREVVLVARDKASAQQQAFEKVSGQEAILGRAMLVKQSGEQKVHVELSSSATLVDVQLTGSDAILQDDFAPIVPESRALLVGVVSDPRSSGAHTGGASLIEQALAALGGGVAARPLPLLPDNEKDLSELGALVLDDPAGLTPEARSALIEWLQRGRVALALMGPRAEAIPLGATHDPFAQGAVNFASTSAKGTPDKASLLLGEASKSLAELNPRARADLEASLTQDAEVLLNWEDDKPFLVEKRVGRGLVWTASLPASIEYSDFALRPGFLALLHALVGKARDLQGQRVTQVGATWTFSEPVQEVIAPGGDKYPVEVNRSGLPEVAATANVDRLGRYFVTLSSGNHTRIALIDKEEILAKPHSGSDQGRRARSAAASQVDISPEFALGLLFLFACELSLRALRNIRLRKLPVPSSR